MNNLVTVTNKVTGESKVFVGDYRIVATEKVFVVMHTNLDAVAFTGDRSLYFFDIDSLDAEDVAA